MDNLNELGAKSLETAKKLGVSGADVLIKTGEGLTLSSQKGTLDKFSISSSFVLGVRVIKDDRVGISYTEKPMISDIESVVKKAIDVASVSKVDPDQKIVASQSLELDESTDQSEIDLQQKTQIALALESDVIKADQRVTSAPYNSLSESRSQTLYMNSLGANCRETYSGVSCYTSALTSENGNQAMHYRGSSGKKFADLDLSGVVQESVQKSLDLLTATPLESGEYKVLFDLNVLQGLWGCFSGVFSAKGAQMGLNPWKEKLGQNIGSDLLTVRNVPGHELAIYRALFDSEGIETKDLVNIEKGVLKNFFHNTATAKHFGTTSTGHGSRGARGHLGVSGHMTSIDVGSSNENQLENLPHLRVISLQGLHSGTNFISGDFSLGCSGYFNGRCVKDFTLSGNFYQMLHQIELLGNKLHASDGKDFFAPKILFSGLKVAS